MKEVVVEVVDSVMGSSKTTECFNWINKNPNDKYIYVSPMLSEVDNGGRIHTSVLGVEFISPSLEDDDKTYKTKSEHLTHLLENGFNIACTHKLYLNMGESHFKLLEKHQYTIILDEEVEVIRSYGSYSKSDIDYLIEKQEIIVSDKDGAISWIGNSVSVDDYEHKYHKLKLLCEKQAVYLNRGVSAKKNVLISHIPLKLLQCAKRVIVITYMFKGSVLDCFLRLKGIKTKPCVDITPKMNLKPSSFRDLITLVPPTKKTVSIKMSKTWWDGITEKDKGSVNSIANLIMNTAKQHNMKAEDIMWTCPKDNAYGVSENNKAIKMNPKGCVKYVVDGVVKYCWLSVHTRATNDYSNKKMVAHCYNRYPLQPIKIYLQSCGVPIDEERYAVSSLLQFVWRSRIRKGEPIVLLIPNYRMYPLFCMWLNDEFEGGLK